MRKQSAIIFDCDGVMFDSRQANINYYNHILEAYSRPPMTLDMIKYVHMHTADESLEYIFRGTGLLEKAKNYKAQLDYSPFIDDMLLEPGLKKLLYMLKPRYGLAVATNRSTTIGQVLEKNGLEDMFDIVVSSLDVKHPKPHPESIFTILDFFGCEPGESCYIGDSIVDFQAARASSVFFISYKNKDLDADYKAGSMEDLGNFFKRTDPF